MNISSADRRDLRHLSTCSKGAGSLTYVALLFLFFTFFLVRLYFQVCRLLCLRRNVWAGDWSWKAASRGSRVVQTVCTRSRTGVP